MTLLHFKTGDWGATLSSAGGNLIRLRYRREKFDLLRTPRPVERLLEAPDSWGVSFSLMPDYALPRTEFELETYADGFGARCRHQGAARKLEFELWIRYQFFQQTMRQSIRLQNFSGREMPFRFRIQPIFRMGKTSSVEVTLDPGKAKAHFDRSSGSVACRAAVCPRPSGFAGAIFQHPDARCRIAYMIDNAYRDWDLQSDFRRNIFVAASQGERLLAAGKSFQLAAALTVSAC